MEKNDDAFRTISEVAEEVDLPQHVLRFWETRFPQIRPLKRAGGRRFYRPHDVEILRAIRRLLYSEGYTIKGVQHIFREQGARSVVAASKAAQGLAAGAPASVVADFGQPAMTEGDDAGAAALAPAAPARVMRSEIIETLRTALGELEECERALERVRRGS